MGLEAVGGVSFLEKWAFWDSTCKFLAEWHSSPRRNGRSTRRVWQPALQLRLGRRPSAIGNGKGPKVRRKGIRMGGPCCLTGKCYRKGLVASRVNVTQGYSLPHERVLPT